MPYKSIFIKIRIITIYVYIQGGQCTFIVFIQINTIINKY